MKHVNKFFYITIGILLIGAQLSAQEIIPFPDLSEHYEHNKNGGKSLDERNYAMFSDDYQESLMTIDKNIDKITSQRKSETRQDIIDSINLELEALRKKRIVLLEEAELVEDLQKFY